MPNLTRARLGTAIGSLAFSPRQTFAAFPLAVLAFDALVRRRVRYDLRWAPVLAAGYALYRFPGEYRERNGAGSRSFTKPPRLLVTDGCACGSSGAPACGSGG